MEEALARELAGPCQILAGWAANHSDDSDRAHRFAALKDTSACRKLLEVEETVGLHLWRSAIRNDGAGDAAAAAGAAEPAEAWKVTAAAAAAAIIPPEPPGSPEDGRYLSVAALVREEFNSNYRPSLVLHVTSHLSSHIWQLAWFRISRVRVECGRGVPDGRGVWEQVGIAIEELSTTMSDTYADVLRTVHCDDDADADEGADEADGDADSVAEEETTTPATTKRNGKKKPRRARSPFGRWLLESEVTFEGFLQQAQQANLPTRGINPKQGAHNTGATQLVGNLPGNRPGARERTWADIAHDLRTTSRRRDSWMWLWENAWRPTLELLRRDARIIASCVPPTADVRKSGLPRYPSESVGGDLPDMWYLLRYLQLETNRCHDWYRRVREERATIHEVQAETGNGPAAGPGPAQAASAACAADEAPHQGEPPANDAPQNRKEAPEPIFHRLRTWVPKAAPMRTFTLVPQPDRCSVPFVRYTAKTAAKLERAIRLEFARRGIPSPPLRKHWEGVPANGDKTPQWAKFLMRLDREDQRLLRRNPGMRVSSFTTNGVEAHFSFTTLMTVSQMGVRKRQKEQLVPETSTLTEDGREQLRAEVDEENAQRLAARTRPYLGGGTWKAPAALGRWYVQRQAVQITSDDDPNKARPLAGITSPEALHRSMLEATPATREDLLRQYGAVIAVDGGVQCKMYGKRIALTKERRDELLPIVGRVAGDHDATAHVEDPFLASTWGDWCRDAFQGGREGRPFIVSEQDVKQHSGERRYNSAERNLRTACGVEPDFAALSRVSVGTHGPLAYAQVLRDGPRWSRIQEYAQARQRRRWRFLAHSKKRSHIAQTAKRVVRFGKELAGHSSEDDPLGPPARVIIALGDGIFPPGGHGHPTSVSHRQYAASISTMFPNVSH